MMHTSEPYYLLDCGHALSGWKVWQKKTFDFARQFDGQLFTRSEIDGFRSRLNDIAATCKNYEEVRPVDWDWAVKYGGNPSISIGYGCSVSFRPIKGLYDGV